MPSTNGTPASMPSMTPDQKHAFARSYAVHIGVDTGKLFHVLVARGPDGTRRKGVRVDVGRPGFDAADEYLTTTFPDVPRERMLVGLEFAGHHGFTFAHHLAQRGYQVVNVLPSVTKRLKEVEDNSQLKTDAKDARLICRLTGDGMFVGFPFLDNTYAELRLLTVARHRLTAEINRYKNRLQSLLDLAWPEFAGEFYDLTKVTPLAVLTRWPLPADLANARPRAVHALVKTASRNHVSAERVDRLLKLARTTIALTQCAATRRAEIQALLARWALAREQAEELDARIAAAVERSPVATLLTSIPEVSALCAATIVAELGTPESYESHRQILKLAGMNLVTTKDSASYRGRARHSKRGRPMLRRQLFLLAGRWCSGRGLYRQQYLAMLERNGRQKTKAVCAISRKLVRLIHVLITSGQPFDRERWLADHRPDGGAPGGGPTGGGQAMPPTTTPTGTPAGTPAGGAAADEAPPAAA